MYIFRKKNKQKDKRLIFIIGTKEIRLIDKKKKIPDSLCSKEKLSSIRRTLF